MLDPVFAQNILVGTLAFYTLVVDEVVGIGLGYEPSFVGFLHEIFITLLMRKRDRILLRLEVQVGALHSI